MITGFNQQVTFPCELTLRTVDGRPHLFRHPIRELASLRSGTRHWSGTVKPGGDQVLTTGPQEAELHLEVAIPPDATLTVNVSDTPIHLTSETATVQLLVDRTSLELFANDGEVSLSRCYLPTDRGIVLTSTAPVQIAATLHTLDSIWPDR